LIENGDGCAGGENNNAEEEPAKAKIPVHIHQLYT
jgi:hypothetical protein